MANKGNPYRLAALATIAVVIAGGLGWSKRDLLLSKTKVPSASKKNPTKKKKSVAPADPVEPAEPPAVNVLVSKSPSANVDLSQPTRPQPLADRRRDPPNKESPAAQKSAPVVTPAHSTGNNPDSAGFAGRVFLALDLNHNGKLETAEIPQRYRDVLAARAKATPGALTFDEFLEALPRLQVVVSTTPTTSAKPTVSAPVNVPVYQPKSTATKSTPAWFKTRDRNGDGQIGLDEWPPGEIEQFKALDKNGDGFLTADEVAGLK